MLASLQAGMVGGVHLCLRWLILEERISSPSANAQPSKHLEVLPLCSLAVRVGIPFQAPGAFLPNVKCVRGSGDKVVVRQVSIGVFSRASARDAPTFHVVKSRLTK